MSMTFPASPTVGETVTGPGGAIWVWDGVKWTFSGTPGASPFGVQNYIDNSWFQINQREYASGAALGVGFFGFDRWQGAVAGTTVTYTATPGAPVTITAGQLQQIIDGEELITGTYTLSWAGTAQGVIWNGTGVQPAVGPSPLQVQSVSGTNLVARFQNGTLSQVQLQIGSVATPWQPLPMQQDLARCQRFFQFIPISVGGPAANAGTTISLGTYHLITTMRASPTVILGTPSFGGVMTAIAFNSTDPSSLNMNGSFNGTGVWAGSVTAQCSADL